MAIGLAAAAPCVALPWWLGGPERGRPLAQRYWVKANLWIAILSFVGNYFWTHYFYTLLGARYTFPSWQLNGVRRPWQPRPPPSQSRADRICRPGLCMRPAAWQHGPCTPRTPPRRGAQAGACGPPRRRPRRRRLLRLRRAPARAPPPARPRAGRRGPQVPLPLYLMTHAYFCFYHALANVVLRRARRAAAGRGRTAAACATAAAVFVLAYATAFMETATIAHFPYYTFKARPALTWSACCLLGCASHAWQQAGFILPGVGGQRVWGATLW
jgi:hypothetical protein